MPDSQNVNDQNQAQGSGNEQGNQQGQQTKAQVYKDFETFVAAQPDDVKSLYESHIAGLKNTVTATREERDTMAKDLRELAKKVEKGSEAEKQLQGLASQLELANRRADFYESAPAHECLNPKVAFALATTNELFDRRGLPMWDDIRKLAPELFGKPVARVGAGNGSGQSGAQDMNSWIRDQARK